MKTISFTFYSIKKKTSVVKVKIEKISCSISKYSSIRDNGLSKTVKSLSFHRKSVLNQNRFFFNFYIIILELN